MLKITVKKMTKTTLHKKTKMMVQ